ncbi:hypothetical protein C5L39_09290 [Corynebacterium alimapuense]|uniref:Uncharacterized protein n=2 Tax=Corynebacterium alimapuense TaxID=1576874 RepID=A0A3M8K5D0_9CORY|nr:hypothetical protein C5L39_09290 [Corynebacterium alimapuense]
MLELGKLLRVGPTIPATAVGIHRIKEATMTCRTFNPRTVAFSDHVSVERTDRAVILNVPRQLDAFAVEGKPTLASRLAKLFSFS